MWCDGALKFLTTLSKNIKKKQFGFVHEEEVFCVCDL